MRLLLLAHLILCSFFFLSAHAAGPAADARRRRLLARPLRGQQHARRGRGGLPAPVPRPAGRGRDERGAGRRRGGGDERRRRGGAARVLHARRRPAEVSRRS